MNFSHFQLFLHLYLSQPSYAISLTLSPLPLLLTCLTLTVPTVSLFWVELILSNFFSACFHLSHSVSLSPFTFSPFSRVVHSRTLQRHSPLTDLCTFKPFQKLPPTQLILIPFYSSHFPGHRFSALESVEMVDEEIAEGIQPDLRG